MQPHNQSPYPQNSQMALGVSNNNIGFGGHQFVDNIPIYNFPPQTSFVGQFPSNPCDQQYIRTNVISNGNAGCFQNPGQTVYGRTGMQGPNYGPNLQQRQHHYPQQEPPICDEDYSDKLISFARFNRNTNLIKEIFSDTVMPDPRNVVSSNRLRNLKVQVRALEEHQRKVDLELEEVEKICLERKKKLLDSTREFNIEYASLLRPVGVTVKTYSEMFLKHYNNFKTEAERQWEQTLAWAQQTAATNPSEDSVESNVAKEGCTSEGLAEILGTADQHPSPLPN